MGGTFTFTFRPAGHRPNAAAVWSVGTGDDTDTILEA